MSIDAMKQALEALDAYSWEQVDAARAALRAAIEQAEKPSDSFVAWNNTQCNPLAPAEKQNLSAWEDGYASGVKAEREACARLLEDYDRFGDTRDCAAAIRARGQG